MKSLPVIFLLLVSLNATSQDIAILLPANNEVPGWVMSGDPGLYEGDMLFQLINGGADLYLEYGFGIVISANYSDNVPNTIQAEIYEMQDSPSAYGIFSVSRMTSQWSDHSNALWAEENDYISFWKGHYFVTVSYSSGKNFDRGVLTEFCEKISSKIQEQNVFPVLVDNFRDLSTNGKPVYLKGNIALSNFYYFDYRNIFEVSEAVAGVGTGYKWIISEYADSTSAIAVLNNAKQKIGESKRFSDLASSFRGFECRDNKSNKMLVRQVDRYIAILISSEPEVQLLPVMNSISSKIETGFDH